MLHVLLSTLPVLGEESPVSRRKEWRPKGKKVEKKMERVLMAEFKSQYLVVPEVDVPLGFPFT